MVVVAKSWVSFNTAAATAREEDSDDDDDIALVAAMLLAVANKTARLSLQENTTSLLVSDEDRDRSCDATVEWQPRYPHACLHLLPEELLQHVYVYVCAPPLCGNWLEA